jgi:serine/threonine-protein kinase
MPDSPDDFVFPVGTRVAGYRIDELVGHGQTAVVFRAFDEARLARVALQLIDPRLAADEAFRDQFVHTTLAAARVGEPHIMPIFAVGQAGGLLYVAMRYVTGGDAGALARRLGPLAPPFVLDLVTAAAAALDASHAAGLVHGSVRPSALLLDARPDGDDYLYLTDFGLATAASATITTGHLPLALDYAAPEQILRRPADGRVDQYALARTAAALLTGLPDSPPADSVHDSTGQDNKVQDNTGHATAARAVASPLVCLADYDLGIPAAVDEVLNRALATAPSERYPSCGEFAAALRGAFEPETSPDPAAAVDLTPEPPAGTEPLPVPGTAPLPARTALAAAVTARLPAPVTTRSAAVPDSADASGSPGTRASTDVHTGTEPSPVLGRRVPARHVADSAADRTAVKKQAGDEHAGGRRGTNRRRRRRARAGIAVVVLLAGGGIVAALVLTRSPAPHSSAHGAAGSPLPGSPVASFARLGGGSAAATRPTPSASPSVSRHATAPTPSRRVRLTFRPASITRSFAAPDGGFGHVDSVAVSPDGGVLAVGDANGQTLLWAADSGRRIATLRAATSADILAVAFSPDGVLVATGTGDGRTFLWSAKTGRLLATAADPGGRQVNTVAFSRDGRVLATAGAGGAASLWKVAGTGTAGRTLTRSRTLSDPLGEGIWSLAFSPDGAVLAAGDYAGATCLWHLASGAAPLVLAGPSAHPAATALAISPDGTTLATGYLNGSVSLWHLGSRTARRAHVFAEPSTVWGAAFSKQGLLALGTAKGTTYVLNPATGAVEDTLTDPATGRQGVGAVAFMPDGASLVAGDTSGKTYLWRLA